MSTTKNFRFLLNYAGDITVVKSHVAIFKIEDSPSPAIFLNYLDSPDGRLEIELGGEAGYYYYIVLKVVNYTQNNIEHTVSTNSNYYVELLATFKWEDDIVRVNPMSTVACVYAFAKRTNIVSGNYIEIYGSKDFRVVAHAIKGNFYETVGKVSDVISSSPNGRETNSFLVFNFLSNLIYYSLLDEVVLKRFVDCVNTIPGVSGKATSCLEAMVRVAQNPFDNVQEIYDIIRFLEPMYHPALQTLVHTDFSPVPDQWTLTIKINDSGAENFLISGTAYTVFDKDNKAWVTNNFRQGTPNSGGHCMVFNPDGSPADISPIMGGGILGPGFGVAVSPDGATIAIGNYGWGSKDYNPVKGSISVFSSDGTVLCPPNGFTNGLRRVQGMCYDPDGNLWMASWGTQAPMEDPTGPHIYDTPPDYSAVVCYVGGDPDKFLVFNEFGDAPSEWHGTFGVVIDREGNCIVSNAGTSKKMASSVYKVKLSTNKDKLEYVADWPGDWDSGKDGQVAGFEELRQPQIDDDGYIYVGGITSCRVVKLDGDTLEKKDEFFDNIYGPWGITIDSVGKKFITGFGGKKQAENVGGIIVPEREFGITVVDADDTGWTNSKLMTLPSGGHEVKLANGQPLYGNQTLPDPDVADLPDEGAKVPEEIKAKKGNKMPPSYSPLMRTTSTSIDRAGNLWCANNWKPSLFADVWANTPNANPGGDGVVIFVGVAEPIRSV